MTPKLYTVLLGGVNAAGKKFLHEFSISAPSVNSLDVESSLNDGILNIAASESHPHHVSEGAVVSVQDRRNNQHFVSERMIGRHLIQVGPTVHVRAFAVRLQKKWEFSERKEIYILLR